MSGRPFDRVRLRGDVERTLSPAEFLALPLNQRIQLVLTRRVEFFRGHEAVDVRDGLAWLRTREGKTW